MKDASPMEKVLLDTDIGSDIDDAVCLAYLLLQKECELLGVTTVTGESHQRAKIASAICRVAGKQVPIIPGLENPLLVEPRQTSAPQAIRLENWSHANQFPQVSAIHFLAERILANPGEVTLLSIGPLTNIALLFSVYPKTISALKQLVMMCGVFSEAAKKQHLVEWNAQLDPHATAMVYNAGVNKHKSIGLDVTLQVGLSKQQVLKCFKHPILQLILDFASVWFEDNDLLTFHDPLAAVSIFDRDICQFDSGRVMVNYDAAAEQTGETIFIENKQEKRHMIASGVNADRFFDAYFEVFNT
jgi:inosine-uridine nucleoside N-ribohydrolase